MIIQLKDSIDQITQTEAVAKIHSLYNYQHTEAENARLLLESEKQKSMLFALGFGVSSFLLLGGGCIVFLYKQKQKEEKRRKAAEELYQSSREAMSDNLKKIADLDVQLRQSKEANDSLEQKLLRIQKEKLRSRNEDIARQKQEMELRLAVFKQSVLYKNLLEAAKNKINMSPSFCPDKWIEIHRNIETIYPGMTSRLRNICRNVSNTELRVCWLSKLRISPSHISVILVLSRQAVTNARASILQKAIKFGHKFDNFAHFIEEI